MPVPLVAASLAALTLAGVATWLVRTFAPRLHLVDIPNERSSHTRKTPCGGGLGIGAGIAAGLLVAWTLGLQIPQWSILLAAALMALVGFLDDWLSPQGLPALARLLVQVGAAGIVILSLGPMGRLPLPPPLDAPLGIFGYLAALIWLTGATNIYNFQDGINGYAGLQGVVAGLGLALAFPGTAIAIAGAVTAAACLGFLFFNWNRASIFMGDVGSYGLGFMLAALPFQAGLSSRGGAMLVAILCLWFFLADGAWTLIVRLVSGRPLFQAHREHQFQRLVDAGAPHWLVAAAIQGATALLGLCGIAYVRTGEAVFAWLGLALAVAGFALLCWITRRTAEAAQAQEQATPGMTVEAA